MTSKPSPLTAYPTVDLSGKIAIVTGGYGGIGAVVSKTLASMGAQVILPARRVDAAKTFAETVAKESPASGPLVVPDMSVDMTDTEQIAAFTTWFLKNYTALDVFCANAGVGPIRSGKTKQGFEVVMGTNHISHVAMLVPLMPLLKSSNARISFTSSGFHHKAKLIMGPDGTETFDWEYLKSPPTENRWLSGRLDNYAQSKLANTVTANHLALTCPELTVVSMSPGAVATGINTKTPFPFMLNLLQRWIAGPPRTPEEGASGLIWTLLSPEVTSGKYYVDGKLAPMSKAATDPKLGSDLWSKTVEWIGLEDPLA